MHDDTRTVPRIRDRAAALDAFRRRRRHVRLITGGLAAAAGAAIAYAYAATAATVSLLWALR